MSGKGFGNAGRVPTPILKKSAAADPQTIVRGVAHLAKMSGPTPTDAKAVLIEHKEHSTMKPKNTICLWFNKDAHEAAAQFAPPPFRIVR